MSDSFYRDFKNTLKALGPFEERPQVAIALSGGGDSMALLFLLRRWVLEQKGHLVAVHVDHGLREGSSREALQVKEWCDALAVPCHLQVCTPHHLL